MRNKVFLLVVAICVTATSGFAAPFWNCTLPRRVPLADRTVPYYAENPRQIARAPQAYPYGYFGAQYRPYSIIHQGYYHEFFLWSYRTGY
jgi:hypothetical protein